MAPACAQGLIHQLPLAEGEHPATRQPGSCKILLIHGSTQGGHEHVGVSKQAFIRGATGAAAVSGMDEDAALCPGTYVTGFRPAFTLSQVEFGSGLVACACARGLISSLLPAEG